MGRHGIDRADIDATNIARLIPRLSDLPVG